MNDLPHIDLALHKYGVKDFSRDECEHCGKYYSESIDIVGRDKPLTLKIQCNDCVDAERTFDRIFNVMRRTNARLSALDPKKDADEIAGFQELIVKQKKKFKIVLENIKRTTKQKSENRQTTGTSARVPYKE